MVFIGCSVVMHPEYTNVSSILSIDRGSSYKQVVSKIGFEPDDVFVQQTTGNKIVVYYYKKKHREIYPGNVNTIGFEKGGRSKYIPKLHKAYFIFDVNDNLLSYITDSGKGNALNLLIKNRNISNVGDLEIQIDSNTDKDIDNNDEGKKKKKRKKINRFF